MSTGFKIFVSLFLLIFLAVGLYAGYAMTYEVLDAFAIRSWTPTPATILESATTPGSGGQHEFTVSYRFEVDGQAYTGHGYDDPDQEVLTDEDIGYLQGLERQFPPGSQTTAYVNLEDPRQAVLAHPSFGILFFLLIPLIFIAVGAGGIYGVWASKSREANAKSITRRSRGGQKGGRWILLFMGVIFTLVGGALFFSLFILPVMQVQEAKSWTPVEATVLSSEVLSHSGDDSVTYSVEIVYEYEYQGQTYRNNRYHFAGGSSSGYDSKREVVDQHPVGETITIYVNPADAAESVIHRGFTGEMWFGLMPLLFFFAGIVMFFASFLFADKVGQAEGSDWLPGASLPLSEATASRHTPGVPSMSPAGGELKRSASPLGKLIGMLFLALFWNGIVSIFLYLVYKGFRDGNPEWFLTFFMIPFVLVGIGLIFGVFYAFLALFNPEPVVHASTTSPALGEEMVINWSIKGRGERISTLTFSLFAQERATYRRGTSTVTDTHTLFEQTLLSTSNTMDIVRGGRIEAIIPSNVMHSLEADNNKIVWKLKLHGDIKRWPDVNDEYPLIVRPMPKEALRRG